MMKSQQVMVGMVALAVLGVIFFLKSTTGAAVGKQVAGALTGFVGGVGGAVADVANNENINPLQPVGSYIGKTIFDWTH